MVLLVPVGAHDSRAAASSIGMYAVCRAASQLFSQDDIPRFSRQENDVTSKAALACVLKSGTQGLATSQPAFCVTFQRFAKWWGATSSAHCQPPQLLALGTSQVRSQIGLDGPAHGPSRTCLTGDMPMSTYPGYSAAVLSPSFRSSLSAGLSPRARTMSGNECVVQPKSPHADPLVRLHMSLHRSSSNASAALEVSTLQ